MPRTKNEKWLTTLKAQRYWTHRRSLYIPTSLRNSRWDLSASSQENIPASTPTTTKEKETNTAFIVSTPNPVSLIDQSRQTITDNQVDVSSQSHYVTRSGRKVRKRTFLDYSENSKDTTFSSSSNKRTKLSATVSNETSVPGVKQVEMSSVAGVSTSTKNAKRSEPQQKSPKAAPKPIEDS